ncbi:MAG: sigma-54 dependent transcriptional regulator [Planctomycetota bacterium]
MDTLENTILVVDDHEATRETLQEMLEEGGSRVVTARNREEAAGRLRAGAFDLILSDLMLPDGSGLDLLEIAKGAQPGVPFVVITGHGTIENAVEATRLGAYEYITKPWDVKKLRLLVRNALHLRFLEQKVGERDALEALIGQSEAMVKLKETILQIARTDATVLIHGETGTGKELVANAFQALSERRDKPFIKVNIAALPRELLESELFGHEKGAFTGAIRTRQGRFELANGGTLFLDEIAEMPPETQVKLLRVLQEREFERVGGMTPIQTDFRLIVATNSDLKGLIARGRFREDLYFRINVVSARIPPLRERHEDIPLLAGHFLQVYNARYNVRRTLTREAGEVLLRYAWPGNIREMENAIERAVVTSSGEAIGPEDLPEEVRGQRPAALGGEGFGQGLPLGDMEKRHILSELKRLGGNKTQLARSLKIGLKTLYRKLDAWGER